jgi:adenylate kinase family enzyme
VKRVAVFGNTGGGKSTLAKKLAELTCVPLYPLDMIQYRAGGAKVPHDEYLKTHAELLRRETWIIDGYGCAESAWERFASADTLVYIDFPLFRHFLWVTKRLFGSVIAAPEGWPEGSPMLRSTIRSYRVLWLCHRHPTPRYRELVSAARHHKRVHHLKSLAEMDAFLDGVTREAEHAGVGAPSFVPADRFQTAAAGGGSTQAQGGSSV